MQLRKGESNEGMTEYNEHVEKTRDKGMNECSKVWKSECKEQGMKVARNTKTETLKLKH